MEILELYHEHVEDGMECCLIWIPGHSGISGNVRADYWAKKAHEKKQMLLLQKWDIVNLYHRSNGAWVTYLPEYGRTTGPPN